MRIFFGILLTLILAAALTWIVTARTSHAERWAHIDLDRLTPSQRAGIEKAEQAREAMFNRLKGHLVEAVKTDGPAGAISVCSEEAPRIAKEVSEEFGVEIGRTSFKTRNPGNAPPEWAQPSVDERTDNPVYLEDRGTGRVAALLPIRMQPECMLCHGPEESIPQDVRTQLETHYPHDQATGFNVGDLRGWFHIVVPLDATGGDAAE